MVIDDRLPVRYNNKLLFCSNREEPNEFWAALLEKAYAKLCGCYENLDGGMTTDALIDMTGGIQEQFEINKKQTEIERNEMWHILVKSRQHKSLIGASIAPNPNIREARLRNGLVMGHAYTVTRIACIEVGVREIRLIRLRNPWGNEAEWRGAWNDNSYEWNAITRDVKEALNYRKLPDGEFWMRYITRGIIFFYIFKNLSSNFILITPSYEDFYRNFEAVEFCELTPDAYSTELKKGLSSTNEPRLTWKLTAYNGEWAPGKSSGGSGNSNPESFWCNPQFLITLTDTDPDDNEDMATIIISLLQKYTREKRIENNGQPSEEFIQFRLYRIMNEKDAESAKKTGQKLNGLQLERCGVSGPYINAREVTHRFRTKPGNYVIIPSCYEANVAGEFLLRIYTENPIDEKNCSVLHTNDPVFKNSYSNDFKSWSNTMTKNISPLNSNINRETRNDYQRLYSTSIPRESSFTPNFSNLYSSTQSSNVYDFRLYDTTLDILAKVDLKKN